jgi:hypothetical protein
MEWNEEPMGPGLPRWMQAVPGALGGGLGLLRRGVAALQTPAPAEDIDSLRRQLRTERAREQHEWRYGSSASARGGGRLPSLAAQGRGRDVDELLRRIVAAQRQQRSTR